MLLVRLHRAEQEAVILLAAVTPLAEVLLKARFFRRRLVACEAKLAEELSCQRELLLYPGFCW